MVKTGMVYSEDGPSYLTLLSGCLCPLEICKSTKCRGRGFDPLDSETHRIPIMIEEVSHGLPDGWLFCAQPAWHVVGWGNT